MRSPFIGVAAPHTYMLQFLAAIRHQSLSYRARTKYSARMVFDAGTIHFAELSDTCGRRSLRPIFIPGDSADTFQYDRAF